jgi:GH35 family endo-1,4-beta-xylanase
MKHTNKILGTMLLSVAVFTSCADMDPLEYAFEKPANMEGMEYLADYEALKDYKSENSSVSPDFKLGIALAATEYNNNGMWTRLANANFDEIVACNEMKMSSIVNEKGAMDFGTVSAFVTNAENYGMNVYGHTLAWHSQQPVKWLNTILADKEIDVDPEAKVEVEDYAFDYTKSDGFPFWSEINAEIKGTASIGMKNGCLEISNAVAASQNYFLQYHIGDGLPTKTDQEYILKVMIKGSSEGSLSVGVGPWSGRANGSISFGTDWEEKEFKFTAVADGGHIMTQSGSFVGTIQIKSVRIVHLETPVMEIAKPIVSNGDAEGDDVTNFVSVECQGKSQGGCTIATGAGYKGSRGFVIDGSNNPSASQNWDTQFFVYANEPLKEGDKIHFSFRYRADVAAKSECQTHNTPGAYIHWNAGSGLAVNFTNDWQTFDKTIVVNADMVGSGGQMQTFAWNLAASRDANKYYFDDIVMEKLVSANSIPLTDQEKKDTLIWAMDKWISGMMEACDGKVKAWDVVNEAISGGDPDSEGVYALQHDNGDANNFFWQDYLGDLDYVRTAVAKAREYGPEDIKLFINDYNLESDWDDNAKLKSLIAWIKRWEADGVTKIDGIGTQMHLTYYSNEDIQASKEKHITKMFELMAASGKLVRVSELDIAFKDAEGNNLTAEQMSDEQLRKVSAFYKWLIQQYINIIPAAQQYGFCIWTAVDADPSTSWTHQQLYGLWDKNFNRTHAYAGFADGLAGK